MGFSFNPSLPGLRDHLRLALGDTDASAQLLADESIDAKLSSLGYAEALAQLAEALALDAAQDPSKYAEGLGGLALEWEQRVVAWQKLAVEARSGRIRVPGSNIWSSVALDQLQIQGISGLRTD